MPERLIGDKAYDSDPLDEQLMQAGGVELIAPDRANRRADRKTQDGRTLRRYRPSGRLMSIGLAIGNLSLFPFGTALGAYAGWVLLKDEVRGLFEAQTP